MHKHDSNQSDQAASENDARLPAPSTRRMMAGMVTLVLLLAGVLLVTLPSGKSPLLTDPRFVVTTKPRFGLPANAPLKDRVFIWWLKLRQKYGKPHPLSYSFGASPQISCSIQGLLNQCMEVGGVRYVIAKDVAAGSVMFGHTNTLNGAEWVKAFTEALQTGQPEWWDPHGRTFRKENLLLLTNGPRTVMVIPKDMAGEFQHTAPK